MINQQKVVQKLLHHSGFKSFNDLQLDVLEKSTQSNNLLILSKTGSGKTLAFLIPLIIRLKTNAQYIQALIIVPSRELAQQIESVFRSLKTDNKVLTCYGGHSIRVEEQSLSEPPTILIGTPGRICDHITRENIQLFRTNQLVIDEYDKCLEMGFEDQMNFICQQLDSVNHTTLVSATELADYPNYLPFINHETINYLEDHKKLKISFFNCPVTTVTKYEYTFELICSFKGAPSMVFCNFRETAEQICDFLRSKGLESVCYHGGMDQDERERSLLKFKNGSYHTLICTDLGARGIDIPKVQHIVHFQYPQTNETFIHRNGRTARMETNGSVYLLINSDEIVPEFISIPEFIYKMPLIIPKPVSTQWITLYISGGKKDKLNKIDIVGFLIQKGGLQKEDIGLINVMDFSSFVAVRRETIERLLSAVKLEKIKGKKWKIGIAR